MFDNREDAAVRLAEKLKTKNFKNPIVIGILRGGGYMAKIVSGYLKIPFGVLPVKKVSPPQAPEAGFGAVVYDGTNIYDEEYARILGIDEEEIRDIVESKVQEARAQYEIYKDFVKENLADFSEVILLDDGVATGYTVLAAAEYLKKKKVMKTVLAIPIASSSAYEYVKKEFDDIICLNIVESVFFAVGMFYKDFRQITDEELLVFLIK